MSPGVPGRSRFRRSRYTSPPRTLNALVGVWFSCLTMMVAPSRCANSGQAYAGVGGTASPTISCARSSCLRSNICPSHQCLAAGEGGGGGFIGGFCRQQHFIVRLAGRNHREAVFQRGDAAIEQHRTLDLDHLLNGAVEIGGLEHLESDGAI